MFEQAILNLTKRPLFAVQIGVHIGKTRLDPLYNLFAQKICKGILVEPVKYLFDKLISNYPDCDLIFENVAISSHIGEADFYRVDEHAVEKSGELIGQPDWFDQIGSLLPNRTTEIWDTYEAHHVPMEWKEFINKNKVVEKVHCETLTSLLDKHGVKEFDILQVDTEGYDYEVLKTLDFERFKPKIIHFERILLSNEDNLACVAMLNRHGYSVENDGDIDCLAQLV
jgi:FkbM family methyltransferase